MNIMDDIEGRLSKKLGIDKKITKADGERYGLAPTSTNKIYNSQN